MKDLHTLYFYQLMNSEFINLTRSTEKDIKKNAAELLATGETDSQTDTTLQILLHRLEKGSDRMEAAAKNPRVNPFTALFDELDIRRDSAFRRFGRQLEIHQLSDDPKTVASAETLIPLWNTHKETPLQNRNKQTGDTDNFLDDTEKEPYAAAIEALKMEPYVRDIRLSNEKYRRAQEERRAKEATEAMDKTSDLRRELNRAYNLLCYYILIMADTYPHNATWDTLLSHLNAIRKRNAELLNRRSAAKGGK